ncbi:M20/M25/M40 family metallo-hydrolase [Natronobiforma cellulositropha]|uniref:M20/M25/M40 family metallo-hydrolase n=1 Tax=Natronobiforma cellulositropha TaxID=1679076 RepID=UPI0021D59543|nr:M20/M25/M40 family metallo-hydrolase [Natronobiforma cellulositropha]
MTFDIDTFHERAVRTPSHHEAGVEEMRELVCETLERAGHDAEVDALGTVLATRGGEDGPHFVLNTHVDTVAPHVAYRREGERVYGRGACDAKGPLAALLAAFLAVEPEAGRLTVAITSDEETLQTGAAHVAETLSADGYIVGEPTGLDVCIAARGQCEATVTVSGASGHAASVAAEENAVYAVGRVLEALAAYDERVGMPTDPVLGEAKLTPTVLAGGETSNRVPETCRITVDRRSVPPETSESFRADLERFLEETLPDVTTSVDLIRPDTPFPDAFVTDLETALVQTLSAASGGEVRPFAAATEASYFAPDAPTVVFGPGVLADEDGPVAHASREYVDLESVERAAAALTETLRAVVSDE